MGLKSYPSNDECWWNIEQTKCVTWQVDILVFVMWNMCVITHSKMWDEASECRWHLDTFIYPYIPYTPLYTLYTFKVYNICTLIYSFKGVGWSFRMPLTSRPEIAMTGWQLQLHHHLLHPNTYDDVTVGLFMDIYEHPWTHPVQDGNVCLTL